MKPIEPKSFLFALHSISSQIALITFLLLILHLTKLMPALSFGALGLALGISNILFAMANGLLSVQDTFVSRAMGEGSTRGVKSYQRHFLVIASGAAICLGVLMASTAGLLRFVIADPALVGESAFYIEALALALPLQILFHCYRAHFQAIGLPQIPSALLWAGNIIFYVGATTHAHSILFWILLSRFLILLPLLFFSRGAGEISRSQLREILQLGLPAGGHMLLEGGVFFLLFMFAARLGPIAMGTQSIVANLVNLAFAIPYGLSIASANEIGRALGAGDERAAINAGWKKIWVTTLVMSALSVFWMTRGSALLKVFGASDPSIDSLVWVIACFQIADGLQILLTGHLRGWGDTKSAMLANGIGHWLIGLPLALYWGLFLKHGLIGLWAGLACGFAGVALMLLARWTYFAKPNRRLVSRMSVRQPDHLPIAT